MRRPLADAGLIFILIIWIFQLIRGIEYPDFTDLDGEYTTAVGTLTRIEYKEKDDTERVYLYLRDVTFSSDKAPELPDRAMIVCYLEGAAPECPIGSVLRLRGTLHAFEPACNPGNFDSRRYNHIMRIYASAANAEVSEVISKPDSLWWKYRNALYDIRHILSKLCDLCFMGDDSGTAKTMLLGDRSSLSAETKSLYSQNGIAHILAISGLHISLMGTAVYSLLKKLHLPLPLRCIPVILLMFNYGMLCGMAASAARAIIMFSLKLSAETLHRTYDAPTALIISAALILIEQPEYIFYSGFLFSFGAIIAVTFVYPQIKFLFGRFPAAGISISLTTLPLQLYNYSYFPFFSLLLNLLVIPLMSVLLVLMFITLTAGAVFLPAGRIAALPVHGILLLYKYSCEFGNSLSFTRMVTGQPQIFQIVLFVVMLTICLPAAARLPKVFMYPLLTFACLILSMNLRAGIAMTCIDVGQGDSIFITDYNDLSILIDAGSTSVDDVGTYRISPFLLSEGCAELDAVFVTHMDADHINGLNSLISESGVSSPRIRNLVFSSATAYAASDEYVELCKLASDKKINLLSIGKGDCYICGKYSFYCLYPDSDCHGEDTNAESLVLSGDLGQALVLLTGDLEGSGETEVTETLSGLDLSGDCRLRILKTAHHGSKNSTSEAFLNAYDPEIALISAGRNNRYGHPHAETLNRFRDRNIQYFATADHGALTLSITGGKVCVKGYLD